MKTDFEMIKRNFQSGEQIKIYPIADVHLGSREHKEKEWNKFLKKIISEENSYVVILGDLCDTALKTSKSDVYQSTMTVMDQMQLATEQLKPLADAGKILGITGGNHEARISREIGLDATYIIAQKLGIEDLYRPNICFIKINTSTTSTTHSKRQTYIIAVTHGSGGGNTYTYLNKNSQFGMCLDGVDIFITGHTHKPAIISPARVRVDRRRNKIELQPFYCVTATSWLDYEGSYALGKMMMPGATTPQIITLSGDENRVQVTM